MSVTNRYRDAWEGFWRDAPEEPGSVIWDAEPELTVRRHLALLVPYLTDRQLPFVDLGCGNGSQTRFLAERFPRAVGVDLSAAAVELSRRADGPGRAEFAQLDATDPEAVRALHGRLGDANVYVRGVIHQSDPADRQPVADAVAHLLGERGRAFVFELAESAKAVLGGLARGPAGPPPKLRPVLAHGLAPAEVADTAFAGLFRAAGLTVLASGEMPLLTTEFTSDGDRIELPGRWVVLGASALRDAGGAGRTD
ncbi:class I SAM-dependent methyltransferase [Kitasatospora sp. NPDC101183]|uniref:class I SAM-dependent methyltransferase n=1 Tax=Kitasatospora sp. NPDC101183 TaxID=3364100 RepID=UPI00382D3531